MLRCLRFLSFAACLAVMVCVTAPASLAEQFAVEDQPGERMVLRGADGQPMLCYEYAHQLGDDGKVTFDTAKVFYHVLAPDGKTTLTKGPGGKFPHHRGIFIGWNRITHDGKRHDLWHVKNTTQKHVSFVKQEPADGQSTVVSRVDWIGKHGKVILEETRSATVHHDTGDAYAVIDFVSTLTAAHGEIELNGDPEHAGIQFRSSQQVAENQSARYVFPVDDAKAKKHAGLDWAAQTFTINGQKWTVQQMSHPENPDTDARWSAYRDYGRFGEFPVIRIPDGESVTLRYRFRVTKGEAPSRNTLNAAFTAYIE